MTLQLIMMYQNTKFGNKMFGSLENIIWIDINILILRCDLDLECSSPIFRQDALAYDSLSSDQVWLPKIQQFRRYSSQSHNLIIWALAVILTLKITDIFFRMTLWLILLHHHTKFGNKMFCGSDDNIRQIFTDIVNICCDLDLNAVIQFFSGEHSD